MEKGYKNIAPCICKLDLSLLVGKPHSNERFSHSFPLSCRYRWRECLTCVTVLAGPARSTTTGVGSEAVVTGGPVLTGAVQDTLIDVWKPSNTVQSNGQLKNILSLILSCETEELWRVLGSLIHVHVLKLVVTPLFMIMQCINEIDKYSETSLIRQALGDEILFQNRLGIGMHSEMDYTCVRLNRFYCI